MKRKSVLTLPLVAGFVFAGVAALLHALSLPVAASPQLAVLPVVDDFESGIPAGFVGFADSWDGSGSLTTLAYETTTVDLPVVPLITDSTAVSVSYFIDPWIPWGFPGYGGVTRDFPETQDWDGYEGFSFWLYTSGSGGAHRVELKSDGVDAFNSNRYEATLTDEVAGWHYVNIPFSDFTARTDFNPGPNPGDPLNLTAIWGYSILLEAGSGGQFTLDQVTLTKQQLVHDFDAGIPAGFVGFADSWDGSGSLTTLAYDTTLVDLPVIPPITSTPAVSVSYYIDPWIPWGFPGYGGVTFDYGSPADWSDYTRFSLLFLGDGSGGAHRVELKADGAAPATSNRYEYTFVDDIAGWRLFDIPFEAFVPRSDFNPGPSPGDPINLSAIWGYSILLAPGSGGTFNMDEVTLYGLPTNLKVAFQSGEAAVLEGGQAVLTVTLNATAPTTVTVEYATADGTASEGSDYTASSGMLEFAPGQTAGAFVVTTLDDLDPEGAETIQVTLSNPVSATLGATSEAIITIIDNDVSAGGAKVDVIDNWNDGQLPEGVDPNGIDIGFTTWSDGSPVAITTTTVFSAGIDPLPGGSDQNVVLQLNAQIAGWGGFSHAFENEAVTEWVSQDWSTYEGLSLWLYGTGSGTTLFVDFMDNRNPGSTTDDAERWTFAFADDFVGWKQINIPFGDFSRKEIGNGAPNDGLTLTEVWGWALGSLNTGGVNEVHFVDDVGLLVRVDVVDDWDDGELPSGTDANGIDIGFATWSDGSPVAITTTTVSGAGIDPVPGIGDESNIVLQFDANIGSWGGFSHAFEDESVSQWISQDWSTYEGLCFWLHGLGTGTTLFVDVIENRNPGSTTDDAERWTYALDDDFVGWRLITIPFGDFTRKEIGNGAPNDGLTLAEVHGWALGSLNTGGNLETHYLDQVAIYGNLGAADVPLEATFSASAFEALEGDSATISVTLNMSSTDEVTVSYATAESSATPDRDFEPVSGELVFAPGETTKTFAVPLLEDAKAESIERIMLNLTGVVNAELGFQRRAVLAIIDDDVVDPDLVGDFEGFHPFAYQSGDVQLSTSELESGSPLALPGQGDYETVATVAYNSGGGFTQLFAEPVDWSALGGLSFWYFGAGNGDTVTFELLDNQTAVTGEADPATWQLVWSDEFNDPAGTPPNPNVWDHAVGDGTLYGIPGWGNSELQFYRDSTDNVATDGAGNLVISAQAVNTATSTLLCWYGPCEYTSGRLLSKERLDFDHGRIEARIKVPSGGDGVPDAGGVDVGDGLWPAFWMLGDDIDEIGWPQTGEIDIMEVVTRQPYEVFGTIHGPGYSGGLSFGDTYTFADPVSDAFHTFAVEWESGEIRWYVDDILYHTATPADVAPNEWVFEHPFYILLNLAVGGNFGGPVGENTGFPQEMLVDYVRVYQLPNASERFTSSFVDGVSGWRQVNIPFDDLSRSAVQPTGAPDDGLTLSEVWGYGFTIDAGGARTPSEATVHLDQVMLAPGFPTSVGLSALGQASTASPIVLTLGLVVFGLVLMARRRRPAA